ncbi:1,6-anhydro-N-acetylmuramyl-L-alanine amidase AmpD [Acidithiobacillus montserratensis]|uniref:1,6-anhydro-N-acetylmuramyl-L-alanine amidase AmpD n=1 Tax=Acidithiobacillus montserratensis TaxID=2729135 RepID=A0ACD5HH38_9PROT|nr:1,6-anhydro-N-acetylmuramyl-L-alanine amidase AmpD [Acidithiobacillus montserratensis]MBU2749115.1 1,6-anhydro-N-acetylmuramyl-L-alanine amidase AmpD [Acidithiobacillus montserratensis]
MTKPAYPWTATGWHDQALAAPSPYYDQRPAGVTVDLLVVHAISLPPEQFGSGEVPRFFTGSLDFDRHPYYEQLRNLRVSTHFFIERDGRLWQHVSVWDRAWHAGVSSWQGRTACNDYSVGIELEGSESTRFLPEQYQRLATLAGDLQRLFPAINPERMVGHADIAPGRKWDPGPGFSWDYFTEVYAHGRDETSPET